ncbi:MAG TPA: TM2 domain-containing protein [Burkholderiales bacterium]|nr:TM2 domain-containing protein [Burkholderiales bacterium]
MTPPVKDALRLKMAGLFFMVLGFVGFAVLGEKMGDIEKLMAAAARDYVYFAGVWLVAAHVFASGLIVLLAGLKNVPLLTSARARRGAWQKLAGSTLIILCFGYVGLTDMPALRHVNDIWWITLPGLAAFLLLARVGFQALRSGWKYDVVTAEQALASDPRPPVVYLRSFEADSEIALRPDGFWRRVTSILFGYAVTFSPEQELAEILNRVGPVIAIGKPGEPLPELGAARLYVGNADWQAKVIDMMARSRLVIIRTGSTPNLQWEIEQTMTRVPRRQILFVSLGDAQKTAVFDQYFERCFGPVIRSTRAVETPLWMKLTSTGKHVAGRIIYFDDSLQPREELIRLSLSWSGLALGLMRPYRDSIQTAMQHVFASLELSWVARNSQTTAVLLALFAGIFGLHHFYLGDRRRGFKYLAFFWTAVPMFAGWYDTVKLARLESRAFDEKYGPRQVTAPTPLNGATH